MLLLILAFIGGLLTILSPCILPVLPFVFARVGQPFARSGLPLLAGMAVTFAAVGLLAAVGGGWAVRANQAGRVAALLLLAVFSLAMLFPSLADRWSRPLVGLGDRLSRRSEQARQAGSPVASSALLGVAAGLLWAPCAGPILGLVFTGAAIRGAGAESALLLLAYALGAGTSLALALVAGGRVAAAL
jgi:cytochrome c biogenesis protein CcdA